MKASLTLSLWIGVNGAYAKQAMHHYDEAGGPQAIQAMHHDGQKPLFHKVLGADFGRQVRSNLRRG